MLINTPLHSSNFKYTTWFFSHKSFGTSSWDVWYCPALWRWCAVLVQFLCDLKAEMEPKWVVQFPCTSVAKGQAAAQVMCNGFQYPLHSSGWVCVLQSGAIKYFFIGYFVVVAPTGALQPSVILQRDFGNVSVLFSLLTATLSSFL